MHSFKPRSVKSSQTKSTPRQSSKFFQSPRSKTQSKRTIRSHAKSTFITPSTSTIPITSSLHQPPQSSIFSFSTQPISTSSISLPKNSLPHPHHHHHSIPLLTHRKRFSTNQSEEISQVTPYISQDNNISPMYNPLATQLGKDHYNFAARTSLSTGYTADPTQASYSPIALTKIADEADSLDIITALQKDQQIELEQQLAGVFDETQRSFIIHTSATNLQLRLHKMRHIRREKQKAIVDQCHASLAQMKAIRSTLSVLDIISLLRGLSVGDPFLQLYALDHISHLQSYMLFFTARDKTHCTLVSQTLQQYVETHPNFTNIKPSSRSINPQSKRATALKTGNTEAVTQIEGNDFGRKRGELLIFSRSDLQWRILDLGTVLVHISYSSERQFTDMESILKPYVIDLTSHTSTLLLAELKVNKCLEITPVSQLEKQ